MFNCYNVKSMVASNVLKKNIIILTPLKIFYKIRIRKKKYLYSISVQKNVATTKSIVYERIFVFSMRIKKIV